MKKFKVKIQSVDRGIRTYWRPIMQKKFFGITYWKSFTVFKDEGTYTNVIDNVCSLEDAKRQIDNLKYIYGEENVEDLSPRLIFMNKT